MDRYIYCIYHTRYIYFMRAFLPPLHTRVALPYSVYEQKNYFEILSDFFIWSKFISSDLKYLFEIRLYLPYIHRLIYIFITYIYFTRAFLPPLHTHREIFSKSCWINPKSDCIHHFPIDLEHKRTRPFAVPNQSENRKYNLISGLFDKISLCV